MRLSITLLFVLFCSLIGFSQTTFKGKLTYKVYLEDTTLHQIFPPETMIIYTNDTLARIETNTAFTGRQVQIRHIEKQKSILLINTPKGKFGIQLVDTSSTQNYIQSKGKGKGLHKGQKTKNMNVRYNGLNKNFIFSYIPKIKTRSLPGFEKTPGLLTKYYVETIDGIYVYELEKMESIPLGDFLFKVPSEYTLIKIDDFIDLMTTTEEE